MNEGSGKRTRKVRPYPVHTLEDSLSIAKAIQHSNSGLPFDRVMLARALGTTPASSSFTMRINSSAKYGLTQGRYNDLSIAITPRGEAAIAPKSAEERHAALRAAAMDPDVFRRFYEMLDGKLMPQIEFAQNLIQRELDIRQDLAEECFRVAEANGVFAGILKRDGDGVRVTITETRQDVPAHENPPAPNPPAGGFSETTTPEPAPERVDAEPAPTQPAGRVFIGSNGSDDATLYVKSVLDEFDVPYSTRAVRPHVGSGLNGAVSDEMRRCSAGILILCGLDEDAPGVAASVMYQLGAASVLYGPRVLIVRDESVRLTPEIDAGLRAIVFQSDVPERAGMALLVALKSLGVIDVLPRSV